MITTTYAIKSTIKALRSGAHENIIRMALLADGFKLKKIDIILRWAKIEIKKGKNNE